MPSFFALAFPALLLVLLTGCAKPAGPGVDAAPSESSNAPETAPAPDPLVLSWTFQTNEGAYGMPETVIYLNAGGFRFPLASGPGMRDMTADQRLRFKAPEGALAAAGYWAGFGVNLLVTQEDGVIRVLRAIWDEGRPGEVASEYQELAAVSVSDILALRNGTDAWETWSGCFGGQHEVTTSTFDIMVENSQVTADVTLVIEDDRNAYHTSARMVGGGQQIGSYLFVERTISIENDTQNDVAIWQLDNASNPQVLTADGNTFARCTS